MSDKIVIEKWELEKIREAVRVALNTQYGTNGLMTKEEIRDKVRKTPETALIRMLKEAMNFCNQYLNK